MNNREKFDMWWTVDEEFQSGCHLWIGGVGPKGYGRFTFDGKRVLAHRAAYTLKCGPIPAGLHVLHRCDVPMCVNVDHLFLGTQADNMRDMCAKGRHNGPRGVTHPFAGRDKCAHLRAAASMANKGSTNPMARLSDDQARWAINCPLSTRVAADRLGVAYGTISDLRAGRTWKHLHAK
jgi:hypothetical protein